MKLVIFGATGSVGRHIVTHALNRGHEVTAFSRRPRKLKKHRYLKRFKGDVLSESEVRKAVEGHDAVLVTLGAGAKGDLRGPGTRNIVSAMEAAGVTRLICQSTLGAGDSEGNLNFFWRHIMFGLLLKKALADHNEHEGHVMESELDWTIVRPAAFTDGPMTGSYRHGFEPDAEGLTLKISRADVAHFMLEQVADVDYLHDTPGLSY